MSAVALPAETPSLDALLREVTLCLARQDAEAALALLAPRIDDAAPLPLRFALAMTAWSLNRPAWAVELLRQCHEAEPMNGTVADVLAALYAQVGDLGESLYMGKLATALLHNAAGPPPEDLLALVPPSFQGFDQAFLAIRERPLFTQAQGCLAAGKLRLAVERARQHVELFPKDQEGRLFCAGALLRSGAAGTALTVLRGREPGTDGDAASLSLEARALAQLGAADEARRLHARAERRAPHDSAIAAARIADAPWLDDSPAHTAALALEWTRRFCRTAPRLPISRRSGDKLVIGYLVSGFADPRDAAAVAAVARAHDRAGVTVVGFGWGAQSWEENAALRGAFDTWRDIAALDPATLARFFGRDGVQIVIDAAGFAAPGSLVALARLNSAFRVAWLGTPAGFGAPLYDARIVASATVALPEAVSPWRIAGGYAVAAGRAHRRDTKILTFGADAQMAQLDAETMALWSALLREHPQAMLVLRDNDMALGPNIERLVQRFGPDLATRIDIRQAELPEDFYAGVDIALIPRRCLSARTTAEAVAAGVPPIVPASAPFAAEAAAFIQDLGLGNDLLAAGERDYAGLAAALARSAENRDRLSAALAAATAEADAPRFAGAIEACAEQALTTAGAP